MTEKLAILRIGGVGVGIKVDESDLAVAVHVGDATGIWERDGVVPTKNDGDSALFRYLLDASPNAVDADLDVTGDNIEVAEVDDAHLGKGIDTGR
jgi:hypothetical protein